MLLPEFSTTSPFILRDPSAETYTLPAFIPGKSTLVSPSLPQNTVGDGRPTQSGLLEKEIKCSGESETLHELGHDTSRSMYPVLWIQVHSI